MVHYLSPHLISEIELLNLILAHKLPMCTFKSITEWAIRNSNKPNKYGSTDAFSNKQSRTRKTVFNEITKTISMNTYQFSPLKINWLPDNNPIQVYIRSFREAVNSLLTNVDLVKEENLSFPLQSSLYLDPDFRLITIFP